MQLSLAAYTRDVVPMHMLQNVVPMHVTKCGAHTHVKCGAHARYKMLIYLT